MNKIDLHQRFSNAWQIIKDPIALTSGLVAFGIVLYIGYRFWDINTEIGNFGETYVYIQYSAHILLAILFGLFVAATIYKIRYFSSVDTSTTTAGSAGWFVGVILIWCPACSISIASYLGLSTFLTTLPGFGLELKIIWLLVLARATYTTIDSLYSCNLSHNKKSLP